MFQQIILIFPVFKLQWDYAATESYSFKFFCIFVFVRVSIKQFLKCLSSVSEHVVESLLIFDKVEVIQVFSIASVMPFVSLFSFIYF